jgi:hypothetical protein
METQQWFFEGNSSNEVMALWTVERKITVLWGLQYNEVKVLWTVERKITVLWGPQFNEVTALWTVETQQWFYEVHSSMGSLLCKLWKGTRFQRENQLCKDNDNCLPYLVWSTEQLKHVGGSLYKRDQFFLYRETRYLTQREQTSF